MTCVYADHKLYECPGSESNSTSLSLDTPTTTLHTLNSETIRPFEDAATTAATNSSDKHSMVQLIESNKMSSWHDIINRNHKYTASPTAQLNHNDIIESLNQITTTLSSTKLSDEIINLNLNSSSDASSSTANYTATTSRSAGAGESTGQFGTRYNGSAKNRGSLKKVAPSQGYEDLWTKYQKRKKYKTTTTTTSSSSLEDGNLGETESAEQATYTTQSPATSNKTSNAYSGEQSDQPPSTLSSFSASSAINDQSSSDNNHLNHHSDYKEINEQAYQFTAYQTAGDEQPTSKLGQPHGNLNLSANTFNNQFNNQFDQSSDSGFKPIFMQASNAMHKPMNQFKFGNSQLIIKEQLDPIDSQRDGVRDNTIHSASSTSNPVLFTGNTNHTSTVISEPSQLASGQATNKSYPTSVTFVQSTRGDNSRDNYRLMVKDVSDQKLKDFIKNNDLIDLSSTAISTSAPINSPQIVPQFLKEKRSRIKNQEKPPAPGLYGKQNTTKPFTNWPKNGFQFQNGDKQQFANYWPYLNYPNYPAAATTTATNLPNFQNLNKQYNSYTLDSITEDPYDYVFGLSKVLPSINANFPPFLPDKQFMLKYPALFSDYYSPMDLQLLNGLNAGSAPSKAFAQKKVSNQDKAPAADHSSAPSSLPGWLKSKFSLKSPISRNTNANSNNNALFSNTNNFLHSAASSSFNYPLYELPPPSLLKQQQQRSPNQPSSQSMTLPLISPTNQPTTNQQLNSLLNTNLLNNQLMNQQLGMVNSPNNLLLNPLLNPTTTTTPQTQQSQQNTRKTFFSQLSRLFSSASIARPVRVPYTAANLASAFSSLAQPFSKLQIDNLSNQLFSPIKGLLNATTSYIPSIRKEPTASGGNKNQQEANAEDDDLDELEKQILNASGISPYSLSSPPMNQPAIGQQSSAPSSLGQSSAVGQHQNGLQSPLNFNGAYTLHHNPMSLGQSDSMYGPIKRSTNSPLVSTYGPLPRPTKNSLASQPLVLKQLHEQLPEQFYPDFYLQPQVRSLMNHKPNELLEQQSTNDRYLSSPPTFPHSSFLASRHDLMDDFIFDNGEYLEEVAKRKRRRKRSIPTTAYAAAPLHAIHYPPKFSYPFLAAPYSPIGSPPIHHAPPPPPLSAFAMPPSYFASPPIQFNYPTPVLPMIPAQLTTSSSSSSSASSPAKLQTGESQFKPQIASLISPTSASSVSSSSSSSSTNSKSTASASLSLASAASQLSSQLAVSLANISKNHKNTKIGKHLSKLTASSNFLPSIMNLTIGLESLSGANKSTIPVEKVAVYQRPPGRSTYTAWGFASIPSKEYHHLSSFADFPFFGQYNALRNLPSAYLIDARTATNLHHPFNGAFNALDLSAFSYQTLPNAGAAHHPAAYPLAALPKLHIEYRPASKPANAKTG